MTPEIETLVTRGTRVRVHRAGKGKPVLFLHGAGGWPAWLPFFERLSQRFALTVPEHPGFGGSDDPRWLRDVPDLAMYYLDLLDTANGIATAAHPSTHDPIDVFGLSRMMNRRGHSTRARELYESALHSGLPRPVERIALRELAQLAVGYHTVSEGFESEVSLAIRLQTQSDQFLSSAPSDSLAPGLLRPLDQGMVPENYPPFPPFVFPQ